MALSEDDPWKRVSIKLVKVRCWIRAQKRIYSWFVKIPVIEIVKNKAEDNKVRLHIKAIDLEKFKLLICSITRYTSINDFVRIKAIRIMGVQMTFENLGIEFT
jgi:hypothetical protein